MESRLTYRDRAKKLREIKIEQTKVKFKQQGYMDSDDHGTIPFYDGYVFEPIYNEGEDFFHGPLGNAKNFEKMLDLNPIYVNPLEILCGRWMDMLQTCRNFPISHLFPVEQEIKDGQQYYGIISGIGADSHCACDYNIGFELGFDGFLKKIRHYKALNTDPEKAEFYVAEELIVTSTLKFIKKHIDRINELLETESREEILETLHEMKRTNEALLSNPPKTFLEACQFIGWFNIISRIYDRDGAGCNLDVILYPYFKRDKEAGILDDEKAIFAIANLLLIDTHYYQLSGADEHDNDMTNELSYLILEAAHWLNSSANLTIRIHDNIDMNFVRKGVEYLFNDRNGWPRFSGDKGLLNYQKNPGATKEYARKRIAVGCNWMALPGMEYPLNDCIKMNTARVFEVAFEEIVNDETEQPSMERLFAAFDKHLTRAVDITGRGIYHHLKHQHYCEPELIMNLMMHDTIERGEDISKCARMNTMGVDGVGLGTVSDSFAAIEQRVVNEKRLTWRELYDVLKSNFEGTEGARVRQMLRSSERYCQGNSLGDKWAKRVSACLAERISSYKMPNGVQLIPGWFSWSNTIAFGKQVGATPDGRLALAPVSHGANPNPGFRTDGAVTAMATGIADIQTAWGNTCPLQLEFDPKISAEDGGLQRVEQVLLTHVNRGGTLININILDKDTIMKAHENPELYPDLVVRVTGFTSYFMVLSPEFRQLVVDRFIDGM